MSADPTTVSAVKLAFAVKRARDGDGDVNLSASDPIAVIGIGCRFPNGANSPHEYWQLLLDGIDAIREIPPDRWIADQWYDPDPHAPGKMNTRWGSFLDNVDRFDPAFFGIAPREAATMDPQQRLVLEVTWDALAHAGIAPDTLAGSATGVFTSIYNADYARMLLADPDGIGAHSCAGASNAIASGRVSYLLDLQGPSISVDTACSSSLVAVHLACQSLRSGDSRIALAGGVALHLSPEHWISLSKLGMLSPDGRCHTFDARANGFVPGEGCGVVVLKRLADAIADGDRVHAVIRGTAVLQDGRSTVMTAPNGLAQQAVVRAALANGRVSPDQITYVETHGTGTALGDPIEVEALSEVLGGSPECALGSVKTNIGHLEAAAGMAGLIKAILALEHEQIPANLHFETPNPHLSLDDTPFVIPTTPRAWPRGSVGRFAGVSGFGFGGTNAHVVLEEAPRIPAPPVRSDDGALLLPISARSSDAVRMLANGYLDCMAATDAIADVCRAAAVRRSHYEERIAVVGSTRDEIRTALHNVVAGRTRAGASRGRATEDSGVVFICSGQGSQWAGMGARLMRDEPAFRSAIEACDASISTHAGWSLIRELEADEETSRLDHTEIAQPAIVAVEIALARLWESWGIVPAAVIGHSVGEIAAAHIAGALELDEAIRIVVQRGRLMERATGSGQMAAVFAAASDVQRDITRFGDRLSMAAINSPQSVVISGDTDAVDAALDDFHARGVSSRMLPVDYAFHSAQMEPFSTELTRTLGVISARTTSIPMISTVTGDLVLGPDLDAAYWGRNVRQMVRLGDAVSTGITSGFRTFVEIGAHPVLSVSVQECIAAADAQNAAVLPSLRRRQDERTTLLTSLGTLYTRGATVDWSAVHPGAVAVVDLPAYPYQRQRYWVRHARASAPGAHTSLRPMLGARVRSPLMSGTGFESQISLATLPFLADHRIGGSTILPMTGFLEIILEAIVETSGAKDVTLEDVLVQQPLVIPDADARTVQVLLEGNRFRVFALDGETWVLHATGRFHTAQLPAMESAPAVPAGSRLHVDEYYRRAQERGAQFGVAFQTVADLSASGNAAVATVRLNEPERSTASNYVIHPALLDGCCQTVLATTGMGDDAGWIPIAIDRFELRAHGQREAQSILTLHPRTDTVKSLAADIRITDPLGGPIAMVADLRLKRMTADVPGRSAHFQYVVRWQPHPRAEAGMAQPSSAGHWLVIGDDSEITGPLRAELERRGERCDVSRADTPLESLTVDGCRGVIHVVDDSCHHALGLAQHLARQVGDTPSLWLVTRDAQVVAPGDACMGFAQAPVLGLARTIALELPDLTCTTIDIDASVEASCLVDEILASDGEDQVALRGADRHVVRLESARSAVPHEQRRLTIPVRGTIEGLTFEPLERRAPGAGEVEVVVDAASLNFRDVMNVLGMYPGEAGALGLEFAGRIARVGENVTRWNVGDRVMGIAWGSFATHVTTPAALITSIPSGLDMEAAATLPNAFLTAHHCLVRTARVAEGEKVLIHSGAGGVGMAAIQLAMDAGAEVFATAGSEQKRAYLRALGVQHVLDSRSLDFSHQILELTGDRGVDVVLNALSGEFIGASFSALTRRGRFVEIGKIGIWTSEQVAALGKEIEYHVIDLADDISGAPWVIGEELDHIAELASTGRVHALPHRVFPFDDAERAFRYMAQARHTGRIVLRIASQVIVRADATYLITGGLGAIGIRTARWLAERGAGHLVLLGRSAPSPAVCDAIDDIRALGTSIEVRAADVARRDQMADVLHDIAASMPPLRGVIHTAGVVDDGVIVQQTWDRFAAVLAPKVAGAWNLHDLTRDIDLDFFALFSSVASVFGSPGQGAYAAGNAFLDALAERRRALGLPALSVNWGAWDGSGMAARVTEEGRRRVLEAVRPMSAYDCLNAFGEALACNEAQVIIADVDWSAWTGNTPSLLADRVRSSAGPVDTFSGSGDPDTDITQQLALAPEASRRGMLIDFVRQEARRVLGLGDSHPIDERQPLLKLGLDSLMAVELRNRLAAALGRPLPATLLFDHPSPAALIDFLTASNSRPAEPVPDELLSDIATMSDEEAERLLERELGEIG